LGEEPHTATSDGRAWSPVMCKHGVS